MYNEKLLTFDELIELILMPDSKEQIDHHAYIPFNIDNYNTTEQIFNFRFNKEQIEMLVGKLMLEEDIRTKSGYAYNDTEALSALLYRFRYPNRLGDLIPMFGHRTKSSLCEVILYVVDHIWDHFSHLLLDQNQPWLSQNHLMMYANAIHNAGCPLTNIYGFIDGTLRPMCRPKLYQQMCYNGHKRLHCLKAQGAVLPNGIMFHLYGGVPGHRHDSAMLTNSGFLVWMNQQFDVNGLPLSQYGDSAYPLLRHLQVPFKQPPNLNPLQIQYNTAMNACRESIEHTFAKPIQLFSFLDFKKNLKLFLSPIAKLYSVGVILTNCHTCFNGSQVSQYFELDPPSLDEYLVYR